MAMPDDQKPRGGLGFAIGAWVLTGVGGLQFLGALTIERTQPLQLGDFLSGRGFVGNVSELIGMNFIPLAGLAFGLFAGIAKRSVLGVYASLVAILVILALTVLQFIPGPAVWPLP